MTVCYYHVTYALCSEFSFVGSNPVTVTICNDKKIPLIPPLLIDNNFITNINKKANILNKVFRGAMCTYKK